MTIITITQETSTLEGLPLYWYNKVDGQREIRFEFKCPHPDVVIDSADGTFATGVYCNSCQNEDMTDDDREGILGY